MQSADSFQPQLQSKEDVARAALRALGAPPPAELPYRQVASHPGSPIPPFSTSSSAPSSFFASSIQSMSPSDALIQLAPPPPPPPHRASLHAPSSLASAGGRSRARSSPFGQASYATSGSSMGDYHELPRGGSGSRHRESGLPGHGVPTSPIMYSPSSHSSYASESPPSLSMRRWPDYGARAQLPRIHRSMDEQHTSGEPAAAAAAAWDSHSAPVTFSHASSDVNNINEAHTHYRNFAPLPHASRASAAASSVRRSPEHISRPASLMAPYSRRSSAELSDPTSDAASTHSSHKRRWTGEASDSQPPPDAAVGDPSLAAAAARLDLDAASPNHDEIMASLARKVMSRLAAKSSEGGAPTRAAALPQRSSREGRRRPSSAAAAAAASTSSTAGVRAKRSVSSGRLVSTHQQRRSPTEPLRGMGIDTLLCAPSNDAEPNGGSR